MTRLHTVIKDAARSNVLGASAFAESVRNDLADEIEKALVEATGGPEHVVVVAGKTWTLQHPLPERFERPGRGESLIDCRFNHLVNVAVGQGAMFDGTHRVWLDRGVLQWEQIGE